MIGNLALKHEETFLAELPAQKTALRTESGSEAELRFLWRSKNAAQLRKKAVVVTNRVMGNTLTKVDSRSPNEPVNFSYSANDRLVQVTKGLPGSETILGQFDYNYEGNRIRHRHSDRGDVDYYYDDGAVLEERNATDDSLLAYYMYADRLIALAQPLGMQYYHHDALGSTIGLTDAAGNDAKSYHLDPWGNIRWETGTSDNRHIFTGKEHDPNTGLVYFGARYYDPEVGRFLTQDTYLGDSNTPPSLHRYLYAYSNPVKFLDRTGNAIECDEFGNCDVSVPDPESSSPEVLTGEKESEVLEKKYYESIGDPNDPGWADPAGILKDPESLEKITSDAEAGDKRAIKFKEGLVKAVENLGTRMAEKTFTAESETGGLIAVRGVNWSALKAEWKSFGQQTKFSKELLSTIKGAYQKRYKGLYASFEQENKAALAADEAAAKLVVLVAARLVAKTRVAPEVVEEASPLEKTAVERRAGETAPIPRTFETLAPKGGFLGGFKQRIVLRKGTVIDRFGGRGGRYTSPTGTPFSARGLPPENASLPYERFEVLKPLPVDAGIANYAFGGGGGIQFELQQSVQSLIDAKFLRVVP